METYVGCGELNMKTDYFWKKKTVVSFILALFVIMIHSTAIEQYVLQLQIDEGKIAAGFVDNLLSETLVRVAVPMFFMLAGATLFRNYENKLYLSKVRSRVKSLIVPYLIWNTLVMLFYLLCSYTPIYTLFLGRERFLLTLPNVIEAVFFYKCNFVFWFVYNLIIYVVLSPVFDLMISKKWMAYMFAIIVLLLPYYATPVFSAVRMNAGSVIFYYVGCYIGKYRFSSFAQRATKKECVIGVMLCLLCIILQMLNIYTIISMPIVTSQIMLIVFCLAFWKAVDIITYHGDINSFVYKYIMPASFFYYALHHDIQSTIVKIIYLVGPKKIWMAYPNLIISYSVTVIIVIGVAVIMQKKCPKIYSILSGNR